MSSFFYPIQTNYILKGRFAKYRRVYNLKFDFYKVSITITITQLYKTQEKEKKNTREERKNAQCKFKKNGKLEIYKQLNKQL